jgi:hypothetical protein
VKAQWPAKAASRLMLELCRSRRSKAGVDLIIYRPFWAGVGLSSPSAETGIGHALGRIS